MLVLILAAVLLFQRQRWLLGLFALALAAHVKLTALLLPVLGLWLARRCGWWRAIRISSVACLQALVLSWLLFVPLAQVLAFAPGQGWISALPALGWGARGGWCAIVVYMFLCAIALLVRWRSRRWQAMRI